MTNTVDMVYTLDMVDHSLNDDDDDKVDVDDNAIQAISQSPHSHPLYPLIYDKKCKGNWLNFA